MKQEKDEEDEDNDNLTATLINTTKSIFSKIFNILKSFFIDQDKSEEVKTLSASAEDILGDEDEEESDDKEEEEEKEDEKIDEDETEEIEEDQQDTPIDQTSTSTEQVSTKTTTSTSTTQTSTSTQEDVAIATSTLSQDTSTSTPVSETYIDTLPSSETPTIQTTISQPAITSEELFAIDLPVLDKTDSQTFKLYNDGIVKVYHQVEITSTSTDNSTSTQTTISTKQTQLLNTYIPEILDKHTIVKSTPSYEVINDIVTINLDLETNEGKTIKASYIFGYDNKQYLRKASFSLNNEIIESIDRLPSLPTPDSGIWLISPQDWTIHFNNQGIDQYYNNNVEKGSLNFVQENKTLISTENPIEQIEIVEDSSNKVIIRASDITHTIYFSGKIYAQHYNNETLSLNLNKKAPSLAFVKHNQQETYLLNLIDLNPSTTLINQLEADYQNPDTPTYLIGSSGGNFNNQQGYYPMIADKDKVEFYFNEDETYTRYYPVFQLENWLSKALPNFYAEVDGIPLKESYDYIISFKNNQPPTEEQPGTLIFQYLGITNKKQDSI